MEYSYNGEWLFQRILTGKKFLDSNFSKGRRQSSLLARIKANSIRTVWNRDEWIFSLISSVQLNAYLFTSTNHLSPFYIQLQSSFASVSNGKYHISSILTILGKWKKIFMESNWARFLIRRRIGTAEQKYTCVATGLCRRGIILIVNHCPSSKYLMTSQIQFRSFYFHSSQPWQPCANVINIGGPRFIQFPVVRTWRDKGIKIR